MNKLGSLVIPMISISMINQANNHLNNDTMIVYPSNDPGGDDPDVPDCCSEKNSSYHSVVLACDNPFGNADTNDSWMDVGLTMWIASGVTNCYAKDAAGMLTIGCNQSLWADKGFWNKSRTSSGGNAGCGDVDDDCIPGTINAIAIVFANLNCCSECPCNR